MAADVEPIGGRTRFAAWLATSEAQSGPHALLATAVVQVPGFDPSAGLARLKRIVTAAGRGDLVAALDVAHGEWKQQQPWYRPPAPFGPGNTASLRHGAWSPRVVDPLARSILEATEQQVTWWTPADRAQAWRWARLEARCQVLVEYLERLGGDLDAEGDERPASALLTRLEREASNLAGRLGLDPLSRARLGRDVAAAQLDVATLMARLEAEEDDDD